MNNKTVLVPTDFTPISKAAYQHASMLAAKTGSKLSLLHVVEKQEEVNSAQKQLNAEVEIVKANAPSLKVDSLIRIGSIFEDIGHTASEIGAEFIVMGTHGKKGWQHLTGSRALKVVTNSKVPFIIVQSKGLMDNKGYDDIVVPMDLHKDTKQKLEHVAKLAKYFNSKVHIITPTETDEFLLKKIKSNIIFAKKYFSEKNVAHDFKNADKNKNFVTEIVRYASEINADLISIMNHDDESFHFFGIDSFEEALITNDAEIAVMCVNPADSMVAGGSVFSN